MSKLNIGAQYIQLEGGMLNAEKKNVSSKINKGNSNQEEVKRTGRQVCVVVMNFNMYGLHGNQSLMHASFGAHSDHAKQHLQCTAKLVQLIRSVQQHNREWWPPFCKVEDMQYFIFLKFC